MYVCIIICLFIYILVHYSGAGDSMRAFTHSRPGFDPRYGQVFWVRIFRGFFLTCKTNVKKL